jgi:hypothetical protein
MYRIYVYTYLLFEFINLSIKLTKYGPFLLYFFLYFELIVEKIIILFDYLNFFEQIVEHC